MSESPQDAKSIFLAALDIADAAEQAAFVERSCGDDAALKQRVEDLLRAYGQPSGPLDKLAAALAPTKLSESAREQAGTMIGRYKLIERIGEGAMGSVWMAQQTEPVKRLVAIKLIKAGADSKTVLTRFEAERQALALMDHPNIAKVFDGGVSDSGSPYFAMELVKGVPITRYCDDRKLTPRERLSLFVPVCQAVQHAHQKGVIHRDIKPTNVLVTQYDGRPVPKVIDFGVAKAVGQPLTEKTLVTGFGAIVGTPAYMSPEQAELNQLDIDTRSDIYALGILLYEILTGSTPFGKEELEQAGLLEILRIIREQDPPRPSTKLSTADALPTIAANRGTEPKALTVIMRSELDWIVMKALEKDRNRRYETANSFAADIERYLGGEAVHAHPPTAAYRLRKFARKNRAPVLGLAAVAAALMVGIGGTTWGLLRARRSEQNALNAFVREADQRDKAERNFARGLLRPIGFSVEPTEAAELRSFVDWSAIEDSQLRVRMLEIALEDPDGALRVARRAERAIQSCVGISPSRRAHAVALFAAKQRDSTADPRIRIAACWLAMELGSADLPAWREGCKWLSDPKNRSLDLFGEFVGFAAGRDDPEQIRQMSVEASLAILETPTNDVDWANSCDGLYALAPRFSSQHAARAVDALVTILEKTPDGADRDPQNFLLSTAGNGFRALAPRLGPSHVARVANSLIAILERSLNPDSDYVSAHPDYFATVCELLHELAPRLQPAQLKHACDVLIAALTKPNGQNARGAVMQGLATLADRLDRQQVIRVAELILVSLEKSTSRSDRGAAQIGLLALGSRLDGAQARRAGNVLLATLQASPVISETALAALAPRLEPAQAEYAWNALISIHKTRQFTKGSGRFDLAGLVTRLQSSQVDSAYGALITDLQDTGPDDRTFAVCDGLEALAPRLNATAARRAWDALVIKAQKIESRSWPDPLGGAYGALGARLEAAQVKLAASALIASLEKAASCEAAYREANAIVALSPRLEPVQTKLAGNALISLLSRPLPAGRSDGEAWNALMALAPRMEPGELKRVWSLIVATLNQWPNTASDPADLLGGRLKAIAPRLDAADAADAGNTLIPLQGKSAARPAACEGLIALAARLDSVVAARAWDVLTSDLVGSAGGDAAVDRSWNALVALAPRLDGASRNDRSAAALSNALDYQSSFYVENVRLTYGARPVADAILVCKSVSSPRSLAKLLSHPACVREQRAILLTRLEELVLYDGRPVFLKPEAPPGAPLRVKEMPARRFHNLHDAAVWIQQNWPDFDLDASCPATWRGSR